MADVLSKEDVTVTNGMDKERQLPKLLQLNTDVCNILSLTLSA